eukprot:2255902-Lingulodinium_polyedra.AAC.1
MASWPTWCLRGGAGGGGGCGAEEACRCGRAAAPSSPVPATVRGNLQTSCSATSGARNLRRR